MAAKENAVDRMEVGPSLAHGNTIKQSEERTDRTVEKESTNVFTKPRGKEMPVKISLIQSKAKQMTIRPYRKKKTELINEIQVAENNIPCYGTQRVEHCEEEGSLWREDCLATNGFRKPR